MRRQESAQLFRKALVLCLDSTYLPYTLFLAQQIHQKEPKRDYDICLISDEPLTIPPEFAHLRLKLCRPLHDEDYLRLKVTHLARSTYLRMWAPRLLACDYDRIIYLDSDIFADATGLSRLFEMDMNGRSLAAVLDVQQWYRPRRNIKEFKLAGRSLRPYFNGGFLLIDTARYIEDRVLERAIDIAQAHPDWICHHDQSLLNLAIDGEWLELSPVWNWQWPSKYPLFTDWVGPRLLHFIGDRKPWHDPKGYCPRRFVLAYSEFFGQYFPSLMPVAEQGLSVLHSKTRLVWLALRFLALRPRLLRYLDQFPDPYLPK
ncbi:glycosyltransferase family 8 protein [Rhodobacter capsulatus]|uniref:Lipopolysaccharide biosynthesis protein, LPS:glycosyltransferase n=1 Tax=Rhodobacter capsulatus TaxID=1061 RepID=A0A1G7EGD5_RHOCA|nr:glycosyltransferase family 8 protein [Rhodobacter capsulatus]WER09444.1 glycosyltransferase family 8 protein [Rhodobacter capsulatus]SDE62702.1 Lipopolysaccharide biosynthesis protein, LPS:glycosyltransferase [Rhodobacter capsulatus]